MGVGRMTIPLFLSTLPEGMSFTVDEINMNVPSGFWGLIGGLPSGFTFPHTYTASDIAEGQPSNKRGAKIATLELATDGVFQSGNGGSFVVKFTISGRPDAYPDLPVKTTKGTLTVGTSQWGWFSRPDQTNFSWQIGEQHQTYTAKTPTLTYLDDSCLAVAYFPDQKDYVFGVNNQQDFLVKLMQGAVGGIIAGHKAVWSVAAGWVAPIGGIAFSVVSFGASAIDGV